MRNIWHELLNKVSKYTDSQFSQDPEIRSLNNRHIHIVPLWDYIFRKRIIPFLYVTFVKLFLQPILFFIFTNALSFIWLAFNRTGCWKQHRYCDVRLCEQKNKDALYKYSNAFQTSISNEMYILDCVRRQTKATSRSRTFWSGPHCNLYG